MLKLGLSRRKAAFPVTRPGPRLLPATKGAMVRTFGLFIATGDIRLATEAPFDANPGLARAVCRG